MLGFHLVGGGVRGPVGENAGSTVMLAKWLTSAIEASPMRNAPHDTKAATSSGITDILANEAF